jgi:tripartite-type tricarboxylate transporter receptor subunit TctC
LSGYFDAFERRPDPGRRLFLPHFMSAARLDNGCAGFDNGASPTYGACRRRAANKIQRSVTIFAGEGTMIRQALMWCGLVAALTVPGSAGGQDFPNRQITIVIGVAAGGVTDVTTRQYAEVVSKNIGQNIVIENRPVAGGAVAAATVQNAAPDGYTLLTIVGSQFASIPAMGPAPYDPVKGFAPITLLFRLPTLVVVPADSPAKTMAELLALGKTKPGGLLMGSPGAGSPGHLIAAKIAIATNTPMQYVHYRGGAPVMADLITGRLDFSFASYNSARSNIDAKNLRALAVDADARISAQPDVPTLTEAGLGEHRVADWFGLVAPAGTPNAIVERLNREFVQTARTPDLIRKLTENGNVAATSTPQEMSKLIADEVKNMEQLIKALGLKPQ